MRFFAFLFLAAFLVSGLIRYSRAEAPPANPAQQAPAPQSPPAAPAPLSVAAAPQQGPLVDPAQAQPAPQVLRHKRRFAKAALRAVQKTPGREPPLPPRRMAKLAKPAPR